jgi:hypothetical protein
MNGKISNTKDVEAIIENYFYYIVFTLAAIRLYTFIENNLLNKQKIRLNKISLKNNLKL